MLKFVDLNYHCHTNWPDPQQVLDHHRLSTGYRDFIKERLNLLMVKHMAGEATLEKEGIAYHFFKSRNRSWYIPFRTHRFLKREKPDVVLVQGFVFVLQVMALRLALGKQSVILVQHHGEKPFKGIKAFFQRLADRSIDGYLFTAKGNAAPWINAKVTRDENKCFEVLSASSTFGNELRNQPEFEPVLKGVPVFLWVGRLNENKDPLLVLKVFIRYLEKNPAAQLYFIYQTDELLAELLQLLNKYPACKSNVHFIGKVANDELEKYYNSAHFYISASHSEGSGYALAEAMACGCMPIVTKIPSFFKMTDNGRWGLLYNPGDEEGLLKVMQQATISTHDQSAKTIAAYAKENLGYAAIANQLYELGLQLQKLKAQSK